MKIHVLSTNFNSGKFCLNNITSIVNQTLLPESHIFIDDVSNFETVEILKKITNSVDYSYINKKYKFEIRLNKNKNFKIKNLYEQITNNSLYKDEDIICIVDGDDWLAKNDVLEKVKIEYENNDLDYLYSNWIYSHNNFVGCSREIPDNKWNPYKDEWITSHLSTFKVKKFRQINIKNFKDNNGNWFEMGCDQAYILPILQLSKNENESYKKIKFINEIFYVYQHSENPLRKRDGVLGKKAHEAVKIIRKRGLIE